MPGTDGPTRGGPPGHPVLRLVDSLSRGLHAVCEVATWSMIFEDQREALVALRRERDRLAELELRVLVSADRNQVGADSGPPRRRRGWPTPPGPPGRPASPTSRWRTPWTVHSAPPAGRWPPGPSTSTAPRWWCTRCTP